MTNEEPCTPEGRLAVSFATALIKGDYAAAHVLMTPGLQAELSPETLRENFYAMFTGYAKGKPERISFNEKECLLPDCRADKADTDLCWA